MNRRRYVLPRIVKPQAFSLLEILVATAMIAAALAAVSQLASISRGHLDRASEKAIAARLAANKLARLTAGVEPLQQQSAQPLAEDPTWEAKVTVYPVTAAPGLAEIEVSVRPAELGNANPAAAAKPWFTLTRWAAASDTTIQSNGAPAAESAAAANEKRAPSSGSATRSAF